MKLIDRITLNRAVSMILNFILSVLKLFVSKKDKGNTDPIVPLPKPPLRKRIPKR
jgi:hypothetical protein